MACGPMISSPKESTNMYSPAFDAIRIALAS